VHQLQCRADLPVHDRRQHGRRRFRLFDVGAHHLHEQHPGKTVDHGLGPRLCRQRLVNHEIERGLQPGEFQYPGTPQMYEGRQRSD